VTEFAIHNCDCVTGFSEHLQPESVDLTVTSIPFGSLFMYSGKTEDVGNNQDGVQMRDSMFGLHLRFVAEQLLPRISPARTLHPHSAARHLPDPARLHGPPRLPRRRHRRLRGGRVRVAGEVAIPKNPQVIAQRQKLHSLLFITGRRNARDLAPAVNDFLLIFQRPGEADPVQALRHEENPAGWVTGDEWIRWARGTWDDIRETDVLEGWQDVREEDDEKHVCPLQLDVIRRCVKLYSNPGDLVLDPFMGIGSSAYVAFEQGRRAVGFELKESYHRQAVRNAARALERGPEGQTSLLDLPEAEPRALAPAHRRR
jgi:hypothetical protein